MPALDLNDYYSAGYFLIRENIIPAWLNEPEELVPDEIISLESEFCPKFNISWGWDTTKPTQALDFGVNESKWDEFERWCIEAHTKEIDVGCMFHSTDAIRRLIKQFIFESRWEKLIVVGVGLHHSCEADWKEPHGTEGVELRILKPLPIETGGQVLGFDVASYAHHNFDHTWLSHGHHRGVFHELGIRPGNHGLLQTRAEAVLAQEYANAHDGFIYEYWLLVSYPLAIVQNGGNGIE